jgi:dual specificity phosphatase 12
MKSPKTHSEWFQYHVFDVLDKEDHDITDVLVSAVPQIHEILNNGGGVYVHCACGMSRSGSVAVAFIMDRTGLDFDEALYQVRKKRPIVLPNPSFQDQIQTWSARRN